MSCWQYSFAEFGDGSGVVDRWQEGTSEQASTGLGYDYLLSMPIYSLTMEKVRLPPMTCVALDREAQTTLCKPGKDSPACFAVRQGCFFERCRCKRCAPTATQSRRR